MPQDVHSIIVGRITPGATAPLKCFNPLYKYHAALTIHRYTLKEQSNILLKQSS